MFMFLENFQVGSNHEEYINICLCSVENFHVGNNHDEYINICLCSVEKFNIGNNQKKYHYTFMFSGKV